MTMMKSKKEVLEAGAGSSQSPLNAQSWASAEKNSGGSEVQFWKVFLNDYRYILQRKKGLQESFNLIGRGQAPPPPS